MASRRAAGNWEGLLKDVTDQLPMSSSDWQYEDVFVSANVRADPQSANCRYSERPILPRLSPARLVASRSNWRPSDIDPESLNADDERPLSLLKTFTSAFRETFLGRAASTVENTLSDSLTAEDPNREINLRQGIPEGGTLVEETDEAESIQHRPSSVLGHISAAIREQVSSNSPISDETARENYLGPETPDPVDETLAEEPSRSADVGSSFRGTDEGNLTLVTDAPVDVLDVRASS